MPIPEQSDTFVFAPIPLLTGQVLTTPEGTAQIRTVEVVLTDTRGQALRVRLEERHGAWWAPRAETTKGLGPSDAPPSRRPTLRLVPGI